jgi:2,4-dienoyl-CoA reductase-like NADH-dependent reductase (Old Yellow Enzyme family)
MPKYFKYKTPDDIAADARMLNLEIGFSDDFSPLFQPVDIGRLKAGNRMAIQPMEGCDGTLDGLPDELTFRRYHRFGAGGAKIIWGEATAVSDESRMNPRQLWLHDGSASAIEDMLAQCRAAHRESCGDDSDLVLGLQLTHSGRYSFRKPLLATHDPILDQRTLDKSTGKFVDDSYPILTDDYLKQLEDQYVAAARLAARIGCDFVDIKQCHRYLLSELLSATNRPGEYGGSLENRTRLVRNIVTRIKSELPDLTIASRMNGFDGIPYQAGEPNAAGERIGEPCDHELPLTTAFGVDKNDHLQLDLVEPIQVAQSLVAWGVELFNISCGNPYACPHFVRPAEYPPIDGYHTPEHPLIGIDRHFTIAKQIQAAVGSVPVIGSAYSWFQEFAMHSAAHNVAVGDVAIMGLGRGTLSHPDFAKHLLDHGKLDRKFVCRTFSYCTNLMRTKDHPLGQYATGCPPFDKSVYQELWKEAEPKLRGK